MTGSVLAMALLVLLAAEAHGQSPERKLHEPFKTIDCADFIGHCNDLEAWQGCLYLLDQVGAELEGANAVVLGRSNIVGMPMALLLVKRNCLMVLLKLNKMEN